MLAGHAQFAGELHPEEAHGADPRGHGFNAAAQGRHARKVGILDADITGPSIPKLFGLHLGEVRGDPMGFLPAIAAENIKICSYRHCLL